MSVPGGCLILGGVCSWGGLLRGWISAPGGCGIPTCTEADTLPPPWTESQTPVRTLPWPRPVIMHQK